VLKRCNENLVGKKVAILGFAFKKNTGDARESPAVDVIRTLLDEQPAEIAIFDPYCDEDDILREIGSDATAGPVRIYTDPYQACSEANAVLVVNDCDQFRNHPAARPRNGSAGEVTPIDKSFGGHEGSPESESHTTLSQAHDAMSAPNKPRDDSLAGFNFDLAPSPACVLDCPDCKSKSRGPVSTEPVEWARIVYSMKEPKWVFDGRGVLDVVELEKLGDVRVDAVGRARAEDGLKNW
jgi:UDPglucose 6-dehydrogenase